MYLVIGVLLLCIGIFMLISPQGVFQLVEGWKSDGAGEPSKLYIISTRIGGGVLSVVGAAEMIVILCLE